MLEIFKKTPRLITALVLLIAFSGFALSSPTVSAAKSSTADSCTGQACLESKGDPAAQGCSKDKCDFVGRYVNPAINLMSVSFGIIAVISIIVGGIQYSASAGDPQKVTRAKTRIQNTIIAIVAYFFLYGFLQFLIPGGIFNK